MLHLQRSRTCKRPWTINIRRLLVTSSDSNHPAKPAGDISSVFPSLKPGAITPPLPTRFADLKKRLLQGHEDQLQESWHRLLATLREETNIIRTTGSTVVPELLFKDMHNLEKRTEFRDQLHKRGVAIIRGVVSEREALGWKELIKRYIQTNPSTKGIQCSMHFRSCLSLTSNLTFYFF